MFFSVWLYINILGLEKAVRIIYQNQAFWGAERENHIRLLQ